MSDPTINQEQFDALIQLLTSIYGRPPTLTEMGNVLQAISGVSDESEVNDDDAD